MNARNPKFTFVQKRDRTTVKFDLAAQITNFLYAKRIEKRSAKTIEAYEQVLNQFRKWYDEQRLSAIDSDTMRQYIHYLSFEKTKWDDHPTSPAGGIGLSPRTVNNNIRNLRIFFNYLLKERVIMFSPMNAVGYQKEDKDTFEIFTDDDVKRLIAAPNRRIYTGQRDATMIMVLADCACRVGELTSLKVSDVDLKLRQITFRAEITKTNTTRVIPVSQRTTKELERLIEFMNVEPDDYLWLTQFGERYLADSFSRMLKKYAKKAGISGVRVSPHTFRHYAAVSMLRNGMDPIAVARILGHTTVRMTEHYVKYTTGDLAEKHEKASPVTKLFDEGNEKKRGSLRFR